MVVLMCGLEAARRQGQTDGWVARTCRLLVTLSPEPEVEVALVPRVPGRLAQRAP